MWKSLKYVETELCKSVSRVVCKSKNHQIMQTLTVQVSICAKPDDYTWVLTGYVLKLLSITILLDSMLQFTAICVCFVNIDHGKMSNGTFIEGLISNNNAHHMSVSLSGFCFSSIIVSLHMEEQNIFQSNPLDLAVLAYLATT